MKRIYEIRRQTSAGFFSNFFWAIAGMARAETERALPVVRFSPSNLQRRKLSAFAQFKPVDLPEDWWSIYFLPHSDFSPEDLNDSRVIKIIDRKLDSLEVEYENVELQRELFRRNSGLQPVVLEAVHELTRVLNLNLPTIGVHLRSTDMHTAPSHPTPPSIEMICKEVKMLAESTGCTRVFIASDSIPVYHKLSKMLSGFVILQVGTDSFPSLAVSRITSYEGGKVLIDAILLGHCSYLIHSKSNVAHAARFFKGSEFILRHEFQCGVNPRSYPRAVLLGRLRQLRAFSMLRKGSTRIYLKGVEVFERHQ